MDREKAPAEDQKQLFKDMADQYALLIFMKDRITNVFEIAHIKCHHITGITETI